MATARESAPLNRRPRGNSVGNHEISNEKALILPARDIDYAAIAVETAIREKFGRQNDLADLKVTAGEKTLRIADSGKVREGTRDQLLAAIRRCDNYAELLR